MHGVQAMRPRNCCTTWRPVVRIKFYDVRDHMDRDWAQWKCISWHDE